jgi:hypothetical protein
MMVRSLALVTVATAAAVAQAPSLAAQQIIELPGEDRVLDVTFEEVFRVGALEGESWEMLGTVRSVAFDGRGNLHVFDGAGGTYGPWRDPRVLVFDANGAFVREFGRSGQGPGEFESLDFLGTTTGDSLVTYDESLYRVQVFDVDGRFARSFDVRPQRFDPDPTGAAPSPEDLSGPDRAVGVVGRYLIVRFMELGDQSRSGVVRWIDERPVAVALEDGAATDLIVVGGEEVMMRGGRRGGRYAFSNYPEFGTAAGRVAVIDTEAYLIRILSPVDGAVERIVRRNLEPQEVTDAVCEEHLAGIMDMVGNAPPEEIDRVEQMWRDFPRAPVLPMLRSIHVDATGHLWVAPYYVAGAEPAPFEIHSPDGTWLGSVSVPPGLQRAFIQYQAPYMEIGEDYILGVWTDELDVQYVRMYELRK